MGEDVNLDMEDLKVFIRLYLEKLELEEGLKLKSRRSQVCILNRKKVKLEKVLILNLADLRDLFIPGEAGVVGRFEY